jgi:hypothetical protein
MDKKTKRLRALMKKHKLDCAAVAGMLGRETNTVRVWRCEGRIVPKLVLEVLEFKLGEHK